MCDWLKELDRIQKNNSVPADCCQMRQSHCYCQWSSSWCDVCSVLIPSVLPTRLQDSQHSHLNWGMLHDPCLQQVMGAASSKAQTSTAAAMDPHHPLHVLFMTEISVVSK
jgi:hypothetical protein